MAAILALAHIAAERAGVMRVMAVKAVAGPAQAGMGVLLLHIEFNAPPLQLFRKKIFFEKPPEESQTDTALTELADSQANPKAMMKAA